MQWFKLPLRTRLGYIAVLLLTIAAVSVVQAANDPLHHRPLYSLVKYAPILFLLWLAWSDLEKIPFWCYLLIPPVCTFCFIKPAAWLIVIPAILFFLFMAPKK